MTANNTARSAPDAFAELHVLVGDWVADAVAVSYRLMAGNTALVETFGTTSAQPTLTVYHVDGPHLMLTHYCAQGNQPRLRLMPAPTGKRYRFRFRDATNLVDPATPYLSALDVKILDTDHFEQTATYVSGAGPADVDTLHFVRNR